MEFLYLFSFMPIISIIFVIWLIIKISSMSGDIAELKRQVNASRQPGGAVVSSPHVPEAPVAVAQNVSVSMHPEASTLPVSTIGEPIADDTPGPIENFFKENVLLKIGVLMILAGFGWFVSYAFINNWIGPAGRITLGFVVGALIAIIGAIRMPKNILQGNVLTVIASALVIITALAGRYYYTFFNPIAVLFIVFLVALYVSAVALAYNSEKLAVYGLLVSLSAPVFSGAESSELINLYLYLLVISIASIWLSIKKGWRSINLIGISGIFLYGLSRFFVYPYHTDPSRYAVLIAVFVIALLYLFVSIWSLIKKTNGATSEDVFLTLINTVFILGGIVAIVPTVYQSSVIACWMLIYAFSGFFVFKKTKNIKLFYIHSLAAILFLVVATIIELNGQILTIALAVEAGIIVVASFVATHNLSIAKKFGFLLLVPGFLSLSSIFSDKWVGGIFHSDSAVLIIMAAILTALGMLYKNEKLDTGTKEQSGSSAHIIAFTLASAFGFIWIWLCTHALIDSSDAAVFVSLFVYTVVGLATHFYGLFHGNDSLKNYGKTVLILVTARLVLVDVWNMELVLRVITFIVLGIMFVSTAFIGNHKTEVK